MSDAQQFLSGGVPKPAGLINGTPVLPLVNTNYNLFSLTQAGYVKSPVTGSLTANVLATVLNLSGRGVISFLGCNNLGGASATRQHRMKVTLDGVVVFDATTVGNTSQDSFFAPVFGQVATINSAGGVFAYIQEPIYFDKSLLVEYASTLTEIGQTHIAYRYYPR